jgi:hypothetical protein
MRDEARHQASQALLTLADLTPAAAAATDARGVIPLEWFRWLPFSARSLLDAAESGPPARVPSLGLNSITLKPLIGNRMLVPGLEKVSEAPSVTIERDVGEQLAVVDQLRVGEHTLRTGWLFVAGRVVGADGRKSRVFQPLVTRPVRVYPDVDRARSVVRPAGDIEVHPGVTPGEARDRFELEMARRPPGIGALNETTVPGPVLAATAAFSDLAVRLAEAAGFEVSGCVPAGDDPEELMRRDGLVVVAGSAIFAARPTGGTSTAAFMASWVADGLTDTWTSFHSLYVDAEEPPAPPPTRPEADITTAGTKPVSPFPLTPAQRRAVVHSRSAPVTVIAGAPGTGKSHTIAAIACDALGRGETVLVGAKSDATIDALVALFERAPGPQPVVFGSNERKDALAARLAEGRRADTSAQHVERSRDELEQMVVQRDAVYGIVASALRAEAALEGNGDAVMAARAAFPMLFDIGADLERIGALIATASHAGGGWLSLRRQRAATEELDDLTGARTDAQRRAFVDGYRLARDANMASQLVAAGGLHLDDEWAALLRLDEEVHDRAARWLYAQTHGPERFTKEALTATAALATALRSGRAVRRQQLSNLGASVTNALPLWVGTLADIEDLLPRSPGLFDLLVLDEASSIDQPLAAPALLRSARTVVVGDPKQLRHVSFLSDEQRDAALAANGVEAGSVLGAKLDVRRNSAFDLAAGAAPVLVLDEHFRCAPHLVDFVARRLYGGEVTVATRTPATQTLDCVDIVRVEGGRVEDGSVPAEVDAVIAELRRGAAQGLSSVGVITPFRAQTDAIEAAIIAAFDAATIHAMGLRVGTVHSFQGNERDTMLLSLGVGTGGSAGSWRFVQDSHLFTVLVTRARRHLVIVTAADAPPGGLVAEYLAQQDAPPGAPRPVPVGDPWVRAIAADLQQTAVPVTAGYPTGRHVVDLCVGDARGFFGVEAVVHPDGADAHIERHLSLRRTGWVLHDAFASRWADRRGELVVELVQTDRAPAAGDVPGAR